jgi:hypothetical protein
MTRLFVLRWPVVILLVAVHMCVNNTSCGYARGPTGPTIAFSKVPSSVEGSPDKLEVIEGRVSGAKPGQHIVLYAQSGQWWVQPLADKPFTEIQGDSTWKNWTHPGYAYAALLVDSRFRPQPTLAALPDTGGAVMAVATVRGGTSSPSKTLAFSGYQWEIRSTASDRGGTRNVHDPANAWTDEAGLFHLRVAKHGEQWTSAEVRLSRSLGYGSYRFVVRDVSFLEPAAVFSLFTRDDFGPSREMDIEIARWGQMDNRNAQYVIQPYYVPANTVKFTAPAGTLTYWLRWEAGRASFRTLRGAAPNNQSGIVAEHTFTSGVPTPGDERVHMNVYVYDNKRSPLQNPFEVVVEKFEFLP